MKIFPFRRPFWLAGVALAVSAPSMNAAEAAPAAPAGK